MSRVASIIGFVAMWIAIIGVIVLLTMAGRVHRESLMVSEVVVTIESPSRAEHLIDETMIRKMLTDAKIKIEESSVNNLPLNYIESVIGQNGFVERVDAYVDYNGVVNIDIVERSALVRLVVDGYNCYITRSGFIFAAPETTALNTQIATGRYRPLFGSKYTGNVRAYTDAEIAKIEREIERVEREKNPIYMREMANNEDKRAIRKRYINRSALESRDDFDKRVAALREDNRKQRELYAYRDKVIKADLKKLEDKQEAYREQQKKLEKKCEDIYNLITFVEMVEKDNFWGGEISQIELSSCEDSDGMRVRFAVRSSRFTVTFGELNSDKSTIKSKFTRLRNFYKEALPRVGWDRYRDINIEFENQVVCKR